MNLPVKSIPVSVPSARSSDSIEKRSVTKQIVNTSHKKCYKDFNDLVKKMKLLKAVGWVISENDKFIRLAKVDVLYVVPKFEIYVDDSLHFTILVFGWLLPDTHQIYKDHLRSIWYITLSSLMQELDLFNLCKGIPDCISSSDQLKKHVIYKSFQQEFFSLYLLRMP